MFIDGTYGVVIPTKSNAGQTVRLTGVQVLQVGSMSITHVSWDSESKVPLRFCLPLPRYSAEYRSLRSDQCAHVAFVNNLRN